MTTKNQDTPARNPMSPKKAEQLEASRAELRALLANTAVVDRQADREIIAAMLRLVERMLYCKPLTPRPPTHNE